MIPAYPLLALLLALRPDPTAAAKLLPPEARWPAVVGCVRVSGGPTAGPVASAVCVAAHGGYAYLLTASHAVPKGQARVFEFFTPESYPYPAYKVIGGDEELRFEAPDLALVKVPIGSKPVPVLRLAGPGQRPKRFPFEAVSVGCPGGVAPTCRAERIAGKKLVRRSGGAVAFFWEAAERPVGGMSGGPLLDRAGRVIGICTAAQDGRGYFTHADEILAGLKKSGYGWLTAQSEP
jgi:hypothetical protein